MASKSNFNLQSLSTIPISQTLVILLVEPMFLPEIAPPGSSWSHLVYIQSGLILSGHFPLRLGYSSLIPHRWESSLVWISGRNMGSTSSITRVWDIGIVDRLCRLKLDLEAVVEDANEGVYSFQIH